MLLEVLYDGTAEGSLIFQFDVITALNVAFERASSDAPTRSEIAVEYDATQFQHGPFSPVPDAARLRAGVCFVFYREPMGEEGLQRFRERLEEIRARRAVVRKIVIRPAEADRS